MNPNIFSIDLNLLAAWLVPKRIRKTRTMAFLRLLVSSFIFIYQDFVRFRSATLYDLMITPQVCYLETMLNDRWDSTLRRIYITDGAEYPALYLYQDAELQEIDLYRDQESQPKYLFTDGEVDGSVLDDFIVMVPVTVLFSAATMRSLVLLKRLPGMKFKIQTF